MQLISGKRGEVWKNVTDVGEMVRFGKNATYLDEGSLFPAERRPALRFLKEPRVFPLDPTFPVKVQQFQKIAI